MAQQTQPKNFDQLLLDAIDKGLSALCPAGKTSIYIHLEGIFNIRKNEIPTKLDGFSNALKRIFGLGAQNLEILIMKNLHAKVVSAADFTNQVGSPQDMSFTRYVELMKLGYIKTEKS